MKHLNIFRTILLILVLLANWGANAQTPDQLHLPPLGSTVVVAGGQGFSDIASATELPNGGFVLVKEVSVIVGSSNHYNSNVYVYNASGSLVSQTVLDHHATTPFSNEYNPRVLVLQDGSFVVSYYSSSVGFALRKFAANGTLTTTAYYTNSPSGSSATVSELILLDNGNIVAYWDNYTARVQQFDPALNPVGALTTIGTIYQSNAPVSQSQLVKLSDGGYALVIDAEQSVFPAKVVAVQQFSASGSTVGTLKKLKYDATSNNQINKHGSITLLTGGGYVVAWHAANYDATFKEVVVLQRYDATGTAVGTMQVIDMYVSETGTSSLRLFTKDPRVTPLSTGGFAIVYKAVKTDNSVLIEANWYVRTYDASLTPITTKTVVGSSNDATPAPSSSNQPITYATNDVGIYTLPTGGLALAGYLITGNVRFWQYDANLNLVGTTDRPFGAVNSPNEARQSAPYLTSYENGYLGTWMIHTTNSQLQRFGFASCLTAPTLSGSTLANTCPTASVNLNSLVTSTAPSGSTIKWFNNDQASGTAVTDPTALTTSGTYYAFYYNSTDNCYTPASSSVTATITACTPPLTASNPAAQTATTGQAKTGNAATELAPTGGTSPYTYSNGSGDAACVAPSGATALTGLTVNSDGTYSYTAPATPGTYYFCIKVCDSATPTATCIVKTYTLTVTAAACTVTGVVPNIIKN